MGPILVVILRLKNASVSHISDDADGVVRDPLLCKHEVIWDLFQLSLCVCIGAHSPARESLDVT